MSAINDIADEAVKNQPGVTMTDDGEESQKESSESQTETQTEVEFSVKARFLTPMIAGFLSWFLGKLFGKKGGLTENEHGGIEDYFDRVFEMLGWQKILHGKAGAFAEGLAGGILSLGRRFKDKEMREHFFRSKTVEGKAERVKENSKEEGEQEDERARILDKHFPEEQ